MHYISSAFAALLDVMHSSKTVIIIYSKRCWHFPHVEITLITTYRKGFYWNWCHSIRSLLPGKVARLVQWGPVSHALNRTKKDSENKFRLLHNATLRTGPFSEEKDALILQRRAEWEMAGDGLLGLLVALEE